MTQRCVCVDGQVSSLLPVISGVPQGRLLGPLFYIIFINNMFDSITVARPFTYADDTKLLMVMEDSFNSVLLQEDHDEVSLWSALWDLSLNPKAIMFITTLAAYYATMNISSTWILSPLCIKSKT